MDRATDTPGNGERSLRWTAISLSVVAFAALLATNRDYAMVWDEGHTVRREQALANWFVLLTQSPDRCAQAFEPDALSKGWPFGREEPDGHPSFYALLGLAGWALSKSWAPPLLAYRIGPMVLASMTIGVVYLHLARRRGVLAGWTAALSILLMPQLFSMAHYAHYDMPLSCLWLLTQISFLNAVRSHRWTVPFGVALGLTIGTKFTGIFALAPAALWVAWNDWVSRLPLYPGPKPRLARLAHPATSVLSGGVAVAIVVLYAIHPSWWFDPIGGPWRFVISNLTRSATIPIPSHFLGSFYRFGLPWYNTIVYTAVCVPVGILTLGLAGIASVVCGRRGDGGEGLLWVSSWGTLMIVRALPIAPGHDGIRLILPSILSLAVLAGLGAAWLRDSFVGTRFAALPARFAGLALGGALIGIVQLYPYTLSFYSEAIGGLKGAERLGFDRTYYWDTMGREFFGWVESQHKQKPIELRFPSTLVNLPFLRTWGELPPVPIFGVDEKMPEAPFYVMQRRAAMFYPYDWWLEKNGHPLFTVRRQGVDLLRVYSYEESTQAVKETINAPQASHLAH